MRTAHRLPQPTGGRSTLEARDVEDLRDTLDRLRDEIAELRASRERLVLAADADLRGIERDLHEGVHQHLVALAVNLQLAAGLVAADPPAAKAVLEDMERDLQQALDETAQLARRVYPALLDARGLGASLRAMVAASGRNARVHGTIGAGCPPEIVSAVYFSVLDVLEHASAGAEVTVTVRDEDGAVVFEVFENETRSDAELDRVRDRVEALGGRLTVLSEGGLGTRVSGALPLAR